MTQSEKRAYLIRWLLDERGEVPAAPAEEQAQIRLLRALLNTRPPRAADASFLQVQDDYLREEIRRRGITCAAELTPIRPGLYLWQGDVTTLRCDAIVNAANRAMLGCFCPNHGCIDNAIHTYSGVQLRLACAQLMRAQGHDEPTGQAKITPAYNLPSRYVIHTVGPYVARRLTAEHRRALADCYRACLTLAAHHGLHSIAFPCISTGEFRFPREEAAVIAIRTVEALRMQMQNPPEVIFNVWKDEDFTVYRRLLGADPPAEGGNV